MLLPTLRLPELWIPPPWLVAVLPAKVSLRMLPTPVVSNSTAPPDPAELFENVSLMR